MVRSKVASSLAIATLLGAGLGVHLGRSAIGAVDPFYFSEPMGTPSYAELVPAASLSRPWSTEIESADLDYGWPAACIGCGSDTTIYAPAPYDGYQDAWTPMPQAAPQYAVVDVEPAIDAQIDAAAAGIEHELQRVERYAYYPVTEEAARAHEAAMVAVLETESPARPRIQPRKSLETLLPEEPIEIGLH